MADILRRESIDSVDMSDSELNLTSLNSSLPKASTSKKRSSHSIETKRAIIQYFDQNPNKSHTDIAKEFNCTRYVVIRALQNRTKFEAATQSSSSKRVRKGEFPQLEEALFLWFKDVRSRNIPIDGPTLQQKGLEFANKLNLGDEFKASDGWIDNFKKRYSISFKSIQGEAGAVTPIQTANWLQNDLPLILKAYDEDDIFNADEFGLFFASLPDKTLALRGERCLGGKQSKLRLTVLACANMSGSEKIPLMVIGKSNKPRCFKNVKTLPVQYRANKRAWMTGELFTDWVQKFNQRMASKNRRVLLILDNCPAHPNVPNLTSVRLIFLPPNTTSVTQPLDQGIIQSVKLRYRRFLLQSRLQAIDVNKSFHLSILDAILMLNRAWQQLSSLVITNCFRKAHFVRDNDSEKSFEEPDFVDIEPLYTVLCERGLAPSSTTLKQYLEIDSQVTTSGVRTDDEILALVTNTDHHDSESDDEEDPPPPPSVHVARNALTTLRSYLYSRSASDDPLRAVDSIENFIDNDLHRSSHQSKLTNFLA